MSKKLSKFLSLILRHKPEKIGLVLDPAGWADVDELIAAANLAGVHLDRTLLSCIVEQNDKQRFSLSEDGTRIRANHGHSIPVDLGLTPLTPPDLLYHGTATRFLSSVFGQGLLPQARRYVHLSVDEPTAVSVGQRHGKPVVLTVRAGQMYDNGFTFYRSDSGIWLTERVPAEYISL